jgi:hypothetical protein
MHSLVLVAGTQSEVCDDVERRYDQLGLSREEDLPIQSSGRLCCESKVSAPHGGIGGDDPAEEPRLCIDTISAGVEKCGRSREELVPSAKVVEEL